MIGFDSFCIFLCKLRFQYYVFCKSFGNCKVFDRDLPDKDDFMGEAHLDLTALGINRLGFYIQYL